MRRQAPEYGLVYKSKEPYEVLFTRWISFEELERLKQVEEMVELYYNSGQFSYTMAALEEGYDSSFSCYEELGDFTGMPEKAASPIKEQTATLSCWNL